MKPRKKENIARIHGEWGENLATDFLRREGYEIIERNSHPVKKDRRLDIDIVAYDHRNDAMVFVEVKQHATHSRYEKRLRSVDKRKKTNLLRGFNAWRRENSWHGNFRFDVIEIYGRPGCIAEIDHVPHVNIFKHPERFVRWD